MTSQIFDGGSARNRLTATGHLNPGIGFVARVMFSPSLRSFHSNYKLLSEPSELFYVQYSLRP
jgi:hypothetical protein